MSTEETSKRGHLDDHAGYERRGLNVSMVLFTGLAMIVAGLLIHYSVVGLFDVLRGQSAAKDVSPSAIMMGQPKKLAPEPRLQSDEAGDLDKLRKNEDAILQSYGWVDRNAGTVRIPVERALDIVAQRGLPSVPVQPQAGQGTKPAQSDKNSPAVQPAPRQSHE